ncbi:MAG: 6-phosphogluconolactonase [Acidobacteria bacterium]|nr:MAG: 6-phosphogluconolactonase [Acidobacteriota bacterium]
MVTVLDTPDQVARVAAERFVNLASQSIADHSWFNVALSGGSTPKAVYELLAGSPYRDQIDWYRTHIFFGDERCVPWDDPDSNYRMAREALLARVLVPAENVYPMKGDGDPDTNAQAYEQTLRSFFHELEWPRFDLTFLGLGEDGHTASLFPETAALREERAWVVANWVEKLKSHRITLTAPAINYSQQILFLVTGEKKAMPLAKIIYGPREPERLPAQLIQPVDGSLEWLVDSAAASRLSST